MDETKIKVLPGANMDVDLVSENVGWDQSIRNLMKNNFINKMAPVKCFAGTQEAELAEGLLMKSEYIFDKYKGDAFSVPAFAAFLKEKSVDEVEIIGVDGGGCVSLTALGACTAGYRVRLNTAAIGTMFTAKRDKYYAKLKALGAEIGGA